MRKSKLFYKDIYESNINLMLEVASQDGYTETSWKKVDDMYRDPDGYPLDSDGLKTRNGIECSADAVISGNRIYQHNGWNENFIEIYKVCRKVPIIFFPKERGGINTSRASIFGDRIDHTLFDLKKYFQYSGSFENKLASAYRRDKTQKWLKSFGDGDEGFKEFVKWLKIDGIFVNSEYEVYDLEHNGNIIKEYQDKYDKKWSENYYENVKEKVIEFSNKVM